MNPGTDWLDQARRAFDALRSGIGETAPTGPASPDAASADRHSADCRWCPVCQVAAVVRGERPEVTAALADVLTATATALRAFAAEAPPGTGADGARVGTADDTEAGPRREAPPPVQRIDIA